MAPLEEVAFLKGSQSIMYPIEHLPSKNTHPNIAIGKDIAGLDLTTWARIIF